MARNTWTVWALVVAAMAWLGLAGAVLGQEEGEDEDDPLAMMSLSADRLYPPSVEKADVTAFARWAELSEAQREAALTLHASYAERHAAAAQKLFDYEEALSGGDRRTMWTNESTREKIQPVRRDYDEHTDNLRDEFVASLRALLTPEQESAGKLLDQRLHYRQNLWLLSGAGGMPVDLVRVLEQVLPAGSTPEGVREVVIKYVAEVDGLVREAEEQNQKSIEAMNAAVELEGEARDQAQAEANKWRGSMAKKNYDAMAAALDRVKKSLPEDVGQRLEARVYTTMIMGSVDATADKLIERVEKLGSLSAEQRAQIAEARAGYLRALIEKMKAQAARIVRLYEERPNEPAGLSDDWGQMWQALADESEKVTTKLRDTLSQGQREEVGPPIAKIGAYVPDFDSDDEPPAIRMSKGQEQFARMASQWSSKPEISEFDLRRLSRAAKFTPEQVEAAKELHEGYMARFRLAARKFSDFQVASAGSNRGGMPSREDLRKQFDVWARYDRHKDRLREEMIEDINVLLTDEQKPSLELLRATSKRKRGGESEMAMMSPGAGVDLPMLVRSALGKLEPNEELSAAMDRYELDMKPSAERVLEVSRGMQEELLKSVQGEGEFNMMSMMGTMQKATDELAKPLAETREVSYEYFQQISPLMPEEVRDEFEESFYRAAGGGRIFAMQTAFTGGGKSVAGLAGEIRELADLSDEQKASFHAAMREHTRAMRDTSKAIYERLVQRNDEATNMMARQMIYSDQELTRLNAERIRADDKMLERLMAILTTEQQGRLPMPYRPAGQVTRPNFEEE